MGIDQIIIPKDSRVVAVCSSGIVRSPLLVEILKENGYKNVSYIGLLDVQKNQSKIPYADYIIILNSEFTKFIGAYLSNDPELITLNVPSNIIDTQTLKPIITGQIEPYLEK